MMVAISLRRGRALIDIHGAPREREMSDPQKTNIQRKFEQFEQRLVMTANGVSELTPQLHEIQLNINDQVEMASLEDAHQQTGVDQVHADYGFDGTGQTVAVIDSGIAWDHDALGAAYGENARVVGGWDFAENDANPYDDGPAGFHGTHVSGIVASDSADHPGVASGVDLVGLRVFDDSGAGSLEWVEQALQWVHEHKDDFENPITTVNLSLGAEWNSDEVPDWGILEDEFRQLKADGLFISVAAGNSFTDYYATGLSYPAVSPFVVPVASHDADGNMSDFSQRNENVLVAPGERIQSAVPDHLFGGSSSNRFISTSGTSMAAPYVAGASALLRQANEFMGVENIDQDLLYEQFMNAADQIYDAATGGYYHKINVSAAIDAVVQDLHSGSWLMATNMGQIADGTVIEGTIGKASDADTFAFEASISGQVTFTIDTTHDLQASFSAQDNNVQIRGNQVTMNVVAGETYKFKIATNAGIGHYKISVSQNDAAADLDAEDWGTTASRSFASEHVDGQKWYQLSAANQGTLTLQASILNSGSSFQVELYDADMNEIATQSTTGDSIRTDVHVQKGEVIYVKVVAENTDVDFHVTNLVSIRSGEVIVNGTAGNDDIRVNQDSSILIDVNGVSYQFASENVDKITVVDNGGYDLLDLQLGDGNDSATLRERIAYVVNEDFEFFAEGFENVTLDAGGGNNLAAMYDSAGNDIFRHNGTRSKLSGAGFYNEVNGFHNVAVYSSGGYDQAQLHGTAGDDTFDSNGEFTALRTDQSNVFTVGFEKVNASGNGGHDSATLFDTSGNDQFVSMPDFASINNEAFSASATGFQRVNMISTAGDDTLVMSDSWGDDQFVQNGQHTIMKGDGFLNYAKGFKDITATSRGGNDVANVFDTAQSDTLLSEGDQTTLTSSSRTTRTSGFDVVNTVSIYGGFDQANIAGSSGDDTVFANLDSVTLVDSNSNTRFTHGFDTVNIDTGDGNDFAALQGSSAREVLTADDQLVEFNTVLQELRLSNTESTTFDGNGGADEVVFSDFEELDLLTAIGDKAVAYLNNNKIVAEDFAFLQAETSDGHSSNYGIEEVDYLFMLRGDWESQ